MKPSLLFFSILPFVQSCGSSSSNDEITPEVPVANTFELSSVLTNKCGVESNFLEVELLLQDDNWQLISRHLPDENGLISLSTDKENINYTLVAKSQQDDGLEGLDIVSFYQADSSLQSKYQARYDNKIDNASCECITQDVELRHRSFASREQVFSSLPFESWQAIDAQTTHYKSAEACRVADEAWPITSFMVLGLDSLGTSIGVADISDDFSANDEQLWAFSAVEVGNNVELSGGQQAMTSAQIIQGVEHFPLTVAEGDSSLILFNSHLYSSEARYMTQRNVVYQQSDTFFGSTITESSHQRISTDYSESFDVDVSKSKPDVEENNFSEINADGSYDYSDAGNYPLAVITYTYSAFDPDSGSLLPATWTSYGPDKGILPSAEVLPGYENLINDDTDIKITDIELLQSQNNSAYNDYIRYYQVNRQSNSQSGSQESSLANDEDWASFVSELKRIHLQITLK